jgi:hypothetical protein
MKAEIKRFSTYGELYLNGTKSFTIPPAQVAATPKAGKSTTPQAKATKTIVSRKTTYGKSAMHRGKGNHNQDKIKPKGQTK